MRLAVNGRFLGARPTGVQRVAHQLVDGLADRAEISLHMPRGVPVPPTLAERVRPVRGLLPGIAWELGELPVRAALADADIWLDPANAGPIRGGRRVLVLHDVFPITHPQWYAPGFRRWFRLAVARSARRATRVITFSEWARREAVRVLGLDADHVVALPQGVGPLDAPAPSDLVTRTLERFGLEPRFLLAVGAGDARKNTGFLVDVLALLRDRGAPVPTLVIAGAPYRHVHGAAPGQPARDAGDRGLPLRRLGFVSDDELRALYTAAAAFCFPSHAEGFGRPPLEAMACGAPVLAANYGSAHEVLGDAAAILPLDPAAWADALARLLDDEDARRRRARAGRDHAAAFRWDRTVQGVLDVCRQAAGTRTGLA